MRTPKKMLGVLLDLPLGGGLEGIAKRDDTTLSRVVRRLLTRAVARELRSNGR